MAIQREITVKLANSPGTLSRVSQLLGAERINMLAMSIEPRAFSGSSSTTRCTP